MSSPSTPSQTVGPFFSIGFEWLNRADLTEGGDGERITIRGRVLDADQQPVPDAVLEIWQADANGRYHHPEAGDSSANPSGFFGFGRVPTDEQGAFSISTIKPGPVAGPDGIVHAPHLQISLFMRGILQRLVTRMYFPGETLNATDPGLRAVPESRRATLIANRGSAKEATFCWDIHLQGANETVFFDF